MITKIDLLEDSINMFPKNYENLFRKIKDLGYDFLMHSKTGSTDRPYNQIRIYGTNPKFS